MGCWETIGPELIPPFMDCLEGSFLHRFQRIEEDWDVDFSGMGWGPGGLAFCFPKAPGAFTRIGRSHFRGFTQISPSKASEGKLGRGERGGSAPPPPFWSGTSRSSSLPVGRDAVWQTGGVNDGGGRCIQIHRLAAAGSRRVGDNAPYR
jgi:hypothetical protein